MPIVRRSIFTFRAWQCVFTTQSLINGAFIGRTRPKGSIDGPPVVGESKNGRGKFFDQEEVNGRVIFTRYAWADATTNAPRFEQSYTEDGGKTWETNWMRDSQRAP